MAGFQQRHPAGVQRTAQDDRWHWREIFSATDELSGVGKVALPLEHSRTRRFCPIVASATPRSSAWADPLVHVELNTQDVAKAKSFYPRAVVLLDAERCRYGRRQDLRAGQRGRGNRRWDDEAPHGRRSCRCGCPMCWWMTSWRRPRRRSHWCDRGAGRDGGDGRLSLSVIIDPTGAALGLWQAKAK